MTEFLYFKYGYNLLHYIQQNMLLMFFILHIPLEVLQSVFEMTEVMTFIFQQS